MGSNNKALLMRCFALTFDDSYLVAAEIVGRVYAGWIPLSISLSGDSNSILVSSALTLTDVMEWGHFWRERNSEKKREQKLSQLCILQ